MLARSGSRRGEGLREVGGEGIGAQRLGQVDGGAVDEADDLEIRIGVVGQRMGEAHIAEAGDERADRGHGLAFGFRRLAESGDARSMHDPCTGRMQVSGAACGRGRALPPSGARGAREAALPVFRLLAENDCSPGKLVSMKPGCG